MLSFPLLFSACLRAKTHLKSHEQHSTQNTCALPAQGGDLGGKFRQMQGKTRDLSRRCVVFSGRVLFQADCCHPDHSKESVDDCLRFTDLLRHLPPSITHRSSAKAQDAAEKSFEKGKVRVRGLFNISHSSVAFFEKSVRRGKEAASTSDQYKFSTPSFQSCSPPTGVAGQGQGCCSQGQGSSAGTGHF